MEKINIIDFKDRINGIFEPEDVINSYGKDVINFGYINNCGTNVNENTLKVLLPNGKLFILTDEIVFMMKEINSPLTMISTRDKKSVITITNHHNLSIEHILALFINIKYGIRIKTEYLFDSALFDAEYLGCYHTFYIKSVYDTLSEKIRINTEKHYNYNYNIVFNKAKFKKYFGINPKYIINFAKLFMYRHLFPEYINYVERGIIFVLYNYPYTLYDYKDEILNYYKNEKNIKIKKKTINKLKYLFTHDIETLKSMEYTKHKRSLIKTTSDGIEYITINDVIIEIYKNPYVRDRALYDIINIGSKVASSYKSRHNKSPSKITVDINGRKFLINHYTTSEYYYILNILKNKSFHQYELIL